MGTSQTHQTTREIYTYTTLYTLWNWKHKSHQVLFVICYHLELWFFIKNYRLVKLIRWNFRQWTNINYTPSITAISCFCKGAWLAKSLVVLRMKEVSKLQIESLHRCCNKYFTAWWFQRFIFLLQYRWAYLSKAFTPSRQLLHLFRGPYLRKLKHISQPVNLNSIYFQISIYAWQHTSNKYTKNGLENKLLKIYTNSSPSKQIVLESVFVIQRWKWVVNYYFIKWILQKEVNKMLYYKKSLHA